MSNTTATSLTGIQGNSGARGSLWYEGAGAPGTIVGQLNNDQYLNTLTGDVYQLVSGSWALQLNITGPAGSSTGIAALPDYTALLVQNNYAASTSCAYLFGNIGTHTLIVTLIGTAGNTPGAPTDTAGNSWTEVSCGAKTEGSGGTARTIRMFYCLSCVQYGLTSSGAVNTVSSTNAAYIEVFEFVGINSFDVSIGAAVTSGSGATNNLSPGSVTTTGASDIIMTLGYGAAGAITAGTVTAGAGPSPALTELHGPTFYHTAWWIPTQAGTFTVPLTDSTKTENAVAITAAFALQSVQPAYQWVGASIAGSAYSNAVVRNGCLRIGNNNTAVTLKWLYPIQLAINGNWTVQFQFLTAGGADTLAFGFHNNGPRAFGSGGFYGAAVQAPWKDCYNNAGIALELYSSPGPVSSANIFLSGNQPVSYTSTSPVTFTSSHLCTVTLSYTYSTNNLLFIIFDTTTNAVYTRNFSVNFATYVGSNNAWWMFGANSGGVGQTTDIYNFKFIGPSQTVDYSCGFNGLGIPG